MDILIRLLIAGGVMGALDFVWLGFIAKNLYYGEMGKILLEKPNVLAAGLFYLIYVVGVVMLVVNPALEKSSWQHALGYGALLGFVAYATYDLTNLATLRGFSAKVVVIDLAWGAFITAAVAVVAYFAVKALVR